MKRIVKRAPAQGYESNYAVSVGMVNWIAQETREPYQAGHLDVLPYSPDTVLEMLVDGQTVRVYNPFGSLVEYTLEEVEP